MIFDNVFSSPRNVYVKKSGDGLSSIFVGDSDDRMGFSLDGVKCSFFEFHKSRKALFLSKTNLK